MKNRENFKLKHKSFILLLVLVLLGPPGESCSNTSENKYLSMEASKLLNPFWVGIFREGGRGRRGRPTPKGTPQQTVSVVLPTKTHNIKKVDPFCE